MASKRSLKNKRIPQANFVSWFFPKKHKRYRFFDESGLASDMKSVAASSLLFVDLGKRQAWKVVGGNGRKANEKYEVLFPEGRYFPEGRHFPEGRYFSDSFLAWIEPKNEGPEQIFFNPLIQDDGNFYQVGSEGCSENIAISVQRRESNLESALRVIAKGSVLNSNQRRPCVIFEAIGGQVFRYENGTKREVVGDISERENSVAGSQRGVRDIAAIKPSFGSEEFVVFCDYLPGPIKWISSRGARDLDVQPAQAHESRHCQNKKKASAGAAQDDSKKWEVVAVTAYNDELYVAEKRRRIFSRFFGNATRIRQLTLSVQRAQQGNQAPYSLTEKKRWKLSRSSVRSWADRIWRRMYSPV